MHERKEEVCVHNYGAESRNGQCDRRTIRKRKINHCEADCFSMGCKQWKYKDWRRRHKTAVTYRFVGGAGGHLSGGERQRISIARAMLKDAPIVILDEATAYTDPENEAILQNSIAKLVAGKTLIVIAHRLSTVKDSDQIFVINDGNVAAHGTHEELLASCPLYIYKEMWNAHISAKDTAKEGE